MLTATHFFAWFTPLLLTLGCSSSSDTPAPIGSADGGNSAANQTSGDGPMSASMNNAPVTAKRCLATFYTTGYLHTVKCLFTDAGTSGAMIEFEVHAGGVNAPATISLIDSTNVSLQNRGGHASYLPNGYMGEGKATTTAENSGQLILSTIDKTVVTGSFRFTVSDGTTWYEFTNGKFTAPTQ